MHPGGWVPEDGPGRGPPHPFRFGRGHRSWGGTCLRSQSRQSPSWVTQGDQACVQEAPNTYSLTTGRPSRVKRPRNSAFLLPPRPTPRPPPPVLFENSSIAYSTQALPEPTLDLLPRDRRTQLRSEAKTTLKETSTMSDTGSSGGDPPPPASAS